MYGNTLARGNPLFADLPVTQRNLVYNHDFRYFSNGVGTKLSIPDGWVYSDKGQGGSIGPAPSGNALLIVTSNDDSSVMQFRQALHEFPRWQETLRKRRVSCCTRVAMPAECQLTATLFDGCVSKSIGWESTTGGDHIYEISMDVSESATGLYISLESRSNAMDITVYQVYANVGDVALDGLECMVEGVIGEIKQYIATERAPAGELGLCDAPRELTVDESRLDSVIAHRFGVGGQGRSLLPDMRGYFVRAWDNGAQTDPDANGRQHLGGGTEPSGDHVGTWQPDEYASHFHDAYYNTGIGGTDGGILNQVAAPKTASKVKTGDSGGKETRPKNIYMLFTMKWA